MEDNGNGKEESKEQETAKPKTDSVNAAPATVADKKAFLVTEKFLNDCLGVRSFSYEHFPTVN